jgi:tryptophan halogenase
MKPISFGIVGGGTAGLISALMLRAAFPFSEITLVASSEVGIIGVGEGSTEHWKKFLNYCDIPLLDMIVETNATHKYGINFVNWSKENPDYFHSVSGDEEIFAWRLFPLYSYLIHKGKLLTDYTGSVGLRQDKIEKNGLHKNVNQFHFDTFSLNKYLTKLSIMRNIKLIDAFVESVNLNAENGNVESIELKEANGFEADFWIDATGFNRVLISKIDNPKWNTFSKYLLVDSALAFPTESEESGKIKPYTVAEALSSGWSWEIPTQFRRGNGYVYSSSFTDHDSAVKEISEKRDQSIGTTRSFTFDPGHLREPWVKNCCAVGLSSSFVEPLEATSIASTIQQIDQLIPYVASYKPGNTAIQKTYNRSFNIMLDNILTMIRMHYMTDRNDTDFWTAAANMPVNDTLQDLLDLLKETTLPRDYITANNGELFQVAHFLHVAQGQGLVKVSNLDWTLGNLSVYDNTHYLSRDIESQRMGVELVDHAEALNEIEKE